MKGTWRVFPWYGVSSCRCASAAHKTALAEEYCREVWPYEWGEPAAIRGAASSSEPCNWLDVAATDRASSSDSGDY